MRRYCALGSSSSQFKSSSATAIAYNREMTKIKFVTSIGRAFEVYMSMPMHMHHVVVYINIVLRLLGHAHHYYL